LVYLLSQDFLLLKVILLKVLMLNLEDSQLLGKVEELPHLEFELRLSDLDLFI
jgi:hypothetical protein